MSALKYPGLYELVFQSFEHSEKGHDIWHALRVVNNAEIIAETEGGNLEIIRAAALLHDLFDSKFYEGSKAESEKVLINLLHKSLYIESEINHIIEIINNISFKGGFDQNNQKSIEFQIVQDADRLDAIGAIGIARAFHYGGFKNREMYNPEKQPEMYMNSKQYRNSDSPTINHFYEKLLLLKDLMNTQTAKNIASQRHEFMNAYLNQFYKEWNNVTLKK